MLLIVRVALQQLIPLARGWGRGRGVQGRWEQRTLLIAIQSLPEVYQAYMWNLKKKKKQNNEQTVR